MAEMPEPETIVPEDLLGKYLSGETDLICILGPTASGKTRYAVWLARYLDRLLSDEGYMSADDAWRRFAGKRVEIISADSRQVYRGMDIGTGKDLSEYGDVQGYPGQGLHPLAVRWLRTVYRGGYQGICAAGRSSGPGVEGKA